MSYQQFRPTAQNRMPRGVLNLIILNVILFVTTQFANSHDVAYQMGGNSSFENILSLHNPFAPDFHFFQYITSMFMHANFTHIAFNMFGLWIFGHLLENAYGTKRFLIFYFVSGVGASLIYQVWTSLQEFHLASGTGMGFLELMRAYPPLQTLLGASGAVYGVMIGAAMIFPNTEMFMMFIPIPIKLKWLAVFYAIAEFVSAFQNNPGDNVAHFAHIGGMLFGFILVKIYSRDKTHFY